MYKIDMAGAKGEKRKTARFNSHKFRLYHRAVKCVAIRILMAHFPGLEKVRFIDVVREAQRDLGPSLENRTHWFGVWEGWAPISEPT